jgi:4'-phosphopantetheinyl transferase EntD
VTTTSLLGVIWEETRVHLPEPLYPAEAEHLRLAVAKRRDEFATVRGCARRALRQLGLSRPAMVPDRGGEPPWPEGIVGSMTHTDGYCAAAVAQRLRVRSLGIDAEQNAPLPEDVLALIAGTAERARLDALASEHPGVAWDRLLFSAKESVYKTWYPVIGTSLGFDDVDLRLGVDGTFTVELTNTEHGEPAARLLSRVSGWWWVASGHLVTGALVLPCPPSFDSTSTESGSSSASNGPGA